MASMSAAKARRIAARVGDVLERNHDQPAVRAYEATIGPKAQAFIAAYDAAARYASKRAHEFQEGQAAKAVLLGKLRAWVPVVARSVPGLDEAAFGAHPDVADDLMADAERLLDLVHDQKAGGAALPFGADLAADLEPALAAAHKEWSEAVAADVAYQSLLKAQRETLAAFDAEIQPFRRTLAGALGRSHKDYQKLRAEKAHMAEEDDEPTAPAASPESAAP
jgi:hypothetical protein